MFEIGSQTGNCIECTFQTDTTHQCTYTPDLGNQRKDKKKSIAQNRGKETSSLVFNIYNMHNCFILYTLVCIFNFSL